MSSTDADREELARVAAALRAQLEWLRDSGAVGLPPHSAGAAGPSVEGAQAVAAVEGGVLLQRPLCDRRILIGLISKRSHLGSSWHGSRRRRDTQISRL